MNTRIRFMTDTAIMVAVAAVLGFLKFEAPWAYGGSVSLEMLPIVLMAFRYGLKGGLVTGLIYGIVDFLIDPNFVVHPIQLFLDYPLAFMAVGFAGIIKPNLDKSRWHQGTAIVMGTLIGSFLRYLCHLVSGAVWFGQYAPKGTPVWIYSIIYNAGYMIPSFILTAVVLILVVVSAPRIVQLRSV